MKRSLRSWLWRVPLDRGSRRRARVPHRDAHARAGRARDGPEDRARDRAVAHRRSRTAQTHVRGPWQKARSRNATDTVARRAQRRCDVRVPADEGDTGFTLVAALTLALGIGANSAMFALADATFLRPLPFSEPTDRLVMLWERRANGFTSMASPLEFREWNRAQPQLRVHGDVRGRITNDQRRRRHARAGRRADGVREVLRCARRPPHCRAARLRLRTPSAHRRWS